MTKNEVRPLACLILFLETNLLSACSRLDKNKAWNRINAMNQGNGGIPFARYTKFYWKRGSILIKNLDFTSHI